MTVNEYQAAAIRTASENSPERLLLNGVMGLCGEAGECIDIVKKAEFQGHPLNREKLMDELGDVLWYVAITAKGLGLTLDEIATHNIDKLTRRYPDGFDRDKSVNRAE